MTAPHIGCWRPRDSTRWTSSSHRLRRRGFGQALRVVHGPCRDRSRVNARGAGSNALVRPHRIGARQLRTALAWSLGDRESALGLRLGVALSRFWEVRGHWSEGLDWLEDALAEAPTRRPDFADVRWSGVVFRLLSRSARVGAFDGDRRPCRGRPRARQGNRGAWTSIRSGDRAAHRDPAAAIDAARKAVALSRSEGQPPTSPSPCKCSVGCRWTTIEMKPALDTRRASRWRAGQEMPSPRSTFCTRWAVCMFVGATTNERASSTRKRWIYLSRLESGGWL